MATNYVEQMFLTKDIILHEFGVMFYQIVCCFLPVKNSIEYWNIK